MDQYRSNSHKSKEELPKPEPKTSVESNQTKSVVSAQVKTTKKGVLQKLVRAFVPEDVHSIEEYVLFDVLVPAAKKIVSDVVDALLYPDGGKQKGGTPASRVSYQSCFNGSSPKARITDTRGGFDYESLLFQSKADAEAVLDAMNEMISRYGLVTVATLYELADVTCNNYLANNYGWKDIGGCRAIPVRDGYILRLPRVVPIER